MTYITSDTANDLPKEPNGNYIWPNIPHPPAWRQSVKVTTTEGEDEDNGGGGAEPPRVLVLFPKVVPKSGWWSPNIGVIKAEH